MKKEREENEVSDEEDYDCDSLDGSTIVTPLSQSILPSKQTKQSRESRKFQFDIPRKISQENHRIGLEMIGEMNTSDFQWKMRFNQEDYLKSIQQKREVRSVAYSFALLSDSILSCSSL